MPFRAVDVSPARGVPPSGRGTRAMQETPPQNPIMTTHVFILGLHRSGTTLLYEMLAAAGAFEVTTAHQVIRHNELRDRDVAPSASIERLRTRFASLGPDAQTGTARHPKPAHLEEYGFVLDNTVSRFSLSRRTAPALRQLVNAMHRDATRDRPPLLKNPWDFGNARRIKQLVPDAKIVYIHRNPFHMLGSLHRLVVSSIRRPNPYLAMLSERYDAFARSEYPLRLARILCEKAPSLLARALIGHVARHTRAFLRDLPSIPSRDRIDVAYEELCARPNEVVCRILNMIGLQAEPRNYRSLIRPAASRTTPEMAAARDLIVKRLSAYATTVGYDLTALPLDL